MQKEKTIEFWDELHQQTPSKEWIVTPSDDLFASIGMLEEHSDVLEIGCGTSSLLRDLYCFYNGTVTCTATDVSAVCIAQNQQRDHAIIAASQGRLTYKILNVLEPNQQLENTIDVILDKGCLDTFLFRSGHQQRESLLRTLLDNVFQWLKDGGQYIVMTPRSRIVLLRDYEGFSSIERTILDKPSSRVVLADMDGDGNKEQCYMFVCKKDSSYVPGEDDQCRGSTLESDDDMCPRCNISFLDFRGNEDVSGRGVKYWTRRWCGHRIHCNGPSDS